MLCFGSYVDSHERASTEISGAPKLTSKYGLNAMLNGFFGSAILSFAASMSDEQRIRSMFVRAFARQPHAGELQRWLAALQDFGGGTPDAWERLAHAFFNTKEFIYYR